VPAAGADLDAELGALQSELEDVHIRLGAARRRQELRQAPLAALRDRLDALPGWRR
jgi:hypothetical protein